MSDEATLLPCPFCGGEAHVLKDGLPYVVIECERCFCRTNCNVTEAEAIAVWNTRAELGSGTCEMVLMWSDYEDGECYKCSKCGVISGDFSFTCGGEPRFCQNCGAKVVKR